MSKYCKDRNEQILQGSNGANLARIEREPGSVARFGCPIRLPRSVARICCLISVAQTGCPDRLPESVAQIGWPDRLPGSVARICCPISVAQFGCPDRLPGSVARDRLPESVARIVCPMRLPVRKGVRPGRSCFEACGSVARFGCQIRLPRSVARICCPRSVARFGCPFGCPDRLSAVHIDCPDRSDGLFRLGLPSSTLRLNLVPKGIRFRRLPIHASPLV